MPQREFEAEVAEDAVGGTEVIALEAIDDDGEQADLRYFIHSGSKDNFVMDERTGVITVGPDAGLDIQRSGDLYDLRVQVVDNGAPFKQTGEATVRIHVRDVNDKRPEFEQVS